jgi:hypothetical protein
MRVVKLVLSTTNPNTARQEITWFLLRSLIGSALLQSSNCIFWMLPAAYLLLSLVFSSQSYVLSPSLKLKMSSTCGQLVAPSPCSHLCLMTESAGQCKRETLPTFFSILLSIPQSARLFEAEEVSLCFPKYSKHRLLAGVTSDSSYFSRFMLLVCYTGPVFFVMYSFTHAGVLDG